jgi:hypothetical protein
MLLQRLDPVEKEKSYLWRTDGMPMPRRTLSHALHEPRANVSRLEFRTVQAGHTPMITRESTQHLWQRWTLLLLWRRWTLVLAPRVFVGTALILLGAVAGLAAGQSMAKRAAHQTGACIALNMAAALGYLDAEQQRQVRHALVTAINPHVDLFSGSRPRLRDVCSESVDG